MSIYAENINTNNYLYRKEITVTEMSGKDHIDLPLKLLLNSSTFNFTLAKADGSDFRIGERSNGSGILHMWVASWGQTTNNASIWFKLPQLLVNETKTLYVYWGNLNADGISDIDLMGFVLADGFDGGVLDTTKWDVFGGYTIGDSKIRLNTNAFIRTKYSPDLCTGGTVTFTETTNPANIFDDNTGTYGDIDNSPVGWVGYEFTEPKVLRRFRVRGHGSGYYGSGFTLKVSTTGAFSGEEKTLYISTESMIWDWKEYDFDSVTAYKYVRIYNASDWQPWRVSEMEFMDDTYMPLANVVNWAIEDGVYLDEALHDTDLRCYGYCFYSPENGVTFDYYGEGDYDRRHNIIDGSTVITYNGTERGLEGNSYSENSIAYYEPTDRVYQGMKGRNTFSNYTENWERNVNGDTRLTDFHIVGCANFLGRYPPYVYIDWVVFREYFGDEEPVVDNSGLYVPYENIEHQTFDYKEYTDDLTSTSYAHKSSFGGSPYNLSNDLCSSENDIWKSDEGAISSDPVYVTIYFDRTENLVSNSKIHYDSGHEKFYNASKMSDNDTDVHGRDHWRGNDISGWAAIDFDDDRPIVNVFGIKAVSTDLDACPKSYKFYGGLQNYTGPFKLLCEGIFEKTVEWQSITFINKNPYKYYKFEIIDTYGNDIKVQEWSMYNYIGTDKPKYISQVRLLPADFGALENNFPKEISLEGSNDMLNWETVMPWTNTYTPYISHNASYGKWQRYSFDNINGYWHYRLACRDNWGASDGRIIICGWELCELEAEASIYRILAGSTNNIQQIWASDGCGFENESGLIYIANEKLNIVQGSKLVEEKDISEFYDDINVV